MTRGKHLVTWTLCLSVSALMLSGCPRLKEKKIVEPCSTPPPSVGALKTVALVGTAPKLRAVLASNSYAVVVGVNDPVGSEKARVEKISAKGVTARIPGNNKVVEIAMATPAASTSTSKKVTATKRKPISNAQAAKEIVQWRVSILKALLKQKRGVPEDAYRIISLALTGQRIPSVSSAMQPLRWTDIPQITSVYLTKLQIKNRKVSIAGVVPDENVYQQLAGRFRQAAPLLSRMKAFPRRPVSGGLQFRLEFDAQLVTADDIARTSPPDEPGVALDADQLSTLKAATGNLPTSTPSFDIKSMLKTIASQNAISVTEIAQHAQEHKDGYMGCLSFNIIATGSMKGLLPFLTELRNTTRLGPAVVVDPLVIDTANARATIHIPYVIGDADVRDPIPPTLNYNEGGSKRFSRARKLTFGVVRDPFTRR